MPDRDRRIRAVPDEVWNWYHGQAVLRGMTIAQYLTWLKQQEEKKR